MTVTNLPLLQKYVSDPRIFCFDSELATRIQPESPAVWVGMYEQLKTKAPTHKSWQWQSMVEMRHECRNCKKQVLSLMMMKRTEDGEPEEGPWLSETGPVLEGALARAVR